MPSRAEVVLEVGQCYAMLNPHLIRSLAYARQQELSHELHRLRRAGPTSSSALRRLARRLLSGRGPDLPVYTWASQLSSRE
ncbi:MAG TPA: hypothetical protein VK425_08520 [Acidimicrobiales bacterium]|nr:hypothetical protein [Acidimicrobiales bacterium]